MALLNLLGIAVPVVAVVYIIYESFFSPLSSIPGPLLARLTKWWLIYHTRRGDLHRELIRLHEQYGDLVRMAPNEVSVADPVAIKKIYGTVPEDDH